MPAPAEVSQLVDPFFAHPADVARHDRMVALVTQMLDLHKRLAAEGTPYENAALQRRIEMTDRQIDAPVHELYGRVERIERKVRRELFPEESLNPKSDREYFQIHLHGLERLPNPIVSPAPRRNPFIPTTWRKFKEAGQINDLFDESPLEDRLWEEFKSRRIPAERQWQVEVGDARY